jgi:NAD(P)-dependent dehydrogenase (short-subunit alcohol dehydrogenase family)
MKLKGKVALVTGAGSGIGRAIALRFAQEGADVIVNDIIDENGKRTEEEIKKLGHRGLYVSGDVSNKKEVEAFVQRGVEKFGTVHILVNNAGIVIDAPFAETKESDWDKVIQVNLKGIFICSQVAARHMIKQRYGKILSISSRTFLGDRGRISYVASKGGVVSFTRSLALDLVEYGINVNCVAPGLVETPILQQIDKRRVDDLLKSQPMGRMGRPEEIANAVLFLVSDEASFITGQTLLVDGGRSLGTGLFV